MRRLMLVLLIVLSLCGCSVSGDIELTQVPTGRGQTQFDTSDPSSAPEPTLAPEPTPTPEPTPVRPVKSVALPTVVSDNGQFLTHLDGSEGTGFVTEMCTPVESLISPGDDAYYVEFNQDRMNNLQLDRPNMPTYTWYLNGSNADKIAEVIIEFDILETIHSLHPGFFGYDKGYFITLHHFQLIPMSSPWCGPHYSQQDTIICDDVERKRMIEIPEFGLDFQKFAAKDGKHVKITIPYSEFQSTAKDLTLQFMSGTTFANLTVNLWGSDELSLDTVDEISKSVELPERDLLYDEIMLALQLSENEIFPYSYTDSSEKMASMIYANEVMAKGLTMNPDNSISMPVSLYDLGKYQKQVQGKYAVIPEGLVPTLMTLSIIFLSSSSM